MNDVHIWPTLAGVVALTPTEFGFSYCANSSEIEKLRADLKAGVPMAKAVGFSGSSCGFKKLVRVESKKGSRTIIVVGRDFLGKAKEDFTFKRQEDREEFYETLLDLLGPNWHCEERSHSSCTFLLAAIFGMLFGLLNILCGGVELWVPRSPTPKPGAQPMPEGILWGLMGFGLVVIAASVAGFFLVRKASKTVWETICLR